MGRIWIAVLAMLAVLFAAASASGAAGQLDRSFSGNGWRATDFAGHSDRGLDVAIQDDRRIVVAGATRLRGADPGFALARYTRNGRSDRSFSSDGMLHTPITGAGDEGATSVAIQSNGRIVAAGQAGFRDEDFAVVRYLRNGRLDDSFGGDGRVTTDVQRTDAAADVAIARSGRIVVAGASARAARNPAFAVAVYNRRGQLLRKFTSEGNDSVELGTASAVAVRPNGGILVAGTTDRSDFHDTFAVARFTGAGELEPSFGDAGIATFDIPSGNDDALTDMALRGGRILLGGWTSNGDGPSDFALARLDGGGDPDPSFSQDGWTTVDYGRDDLLFDLAVQPNGRTVAVGQTRRGAAIARLGASGALDRSFSGDGKAVLSEPGKSSRFEAAAMQGANIVASGFTSFDDRSDFLVARFRG
jgi:uncharacterized delta-60 repeat protein